MARRVGRPGLAAGHARKNARLDPACRLWILIIAIAQTDADQVDHPSGSLERNGRREWTPKLPHMKNFLCSPRDSPRVAEISAQ